MKKGTAERENVFDRC